MSVEEFCAIEKETLNRFCVFLKILWLKLKIAFNLENKTNNISDKRSTWFTLYVTYFQAQINYNFIGVVNFIIEQFCPI